MVLVLVQLLVARGRDQEVEEKTSDRRPRLSRKSPVSRLSSQLPGAHDGNGGSRLLQL